MTSYGLLIFEGAEELDFAGPWEVFTVSSMLREHADRVVLDRTWSWPRAVRQGDAGAS